MVEKIVRMQKPIKNTEKIVLFRSLLKDGMTPKQANEYIKSITIEIKNNHSKYVKKTRERKKKISFAKKFTKMINKNKGK